MKHTPTPQQLAEAERWFARLLDPDISPMERMAYQHWRATPAHALAFDQVERLWAQVGAAAGRAEVRQLMRQTLRETARPRVRWRQSAALAASLLVAALALGALWLWQNPPGLYRTALGEQKTVTLADGSTVILNTNSRLRVVYRDSAREIDLQQGEALFDVAHDAARPFKVAAGRGSVTALGTRFTVRREDDELRVTLLEGRVVVDRNEGHPSLEVAPGEQLRIRPEQPAVERQQVDEDAVVSWTRGRLLFRATPLAEAVREVNRYARQRIHILDPSLNLLPVSGTFVTGDAENLAAALGAEMSIEVRYSEDGREIGLAKRTP